MSEGFKHRLKLDPRGPDRLWSNETKRQIIDALVHGKGIKTAQE